jgi:glutathione S-transferase
MNYVDIVAMLQYLTFGTLVGSARGRYGIRGPATTGSEPFERVYRVQMNTLELLVALIPVMYAAARYWPAHYVAALGAVYLIGRTIYAFAYVKNPQSRHLGFALSIFPILALALAALVAALRSM